MVVAVLSGVAVVGLGARPGVEVLNAVPLERGYVGTTYAFDGLVCVGSQVTSTRVTGVEDSGQQDASVERATRCRQASPSAGCGCSSRPPGPAR